MRDNQRKEDPMWLRYEAVRPEIYRTDTYNGNSFVNWVNRYGHRHLEKPFSEANHFSRVLEVGAGTGMHLDYVRHRYDEYMMTDADSNLLEEAEQQHSGKSGVRFEVIDAAFPPYEDNEFDRVISVYNLEHISEPHSVIEQWIRVTRPGGIISIAIPTEGGLAWNTGRAMTTKKAYDRHNLDVHYILAREHVNACYKLVALLRHYLPELQESWFPFGIPSAHINLIYCCTAVKS